MHTSTPAADGLLVGLDVGTTSVKALVMAPDGTEIAIGRAPTHWVATDTGAETSADSIVDSALEALTDALQHRPEDRVLAIGVASMAEAGILVDANEVSVAPVIAWHDHRDHAELAELERDLGGREFARHTGLSLWTQWSVTKHRWLRANHPSARRATQRYNVAEWIVRALGGSPACELSLASRTGWLDLRSGSLWQESLDWSGLSRAVIPELVTAGTPLGTATVGDALSAIDGAILTSAGHDHQAAAIGVGLRNPGDEFDSCGTAEALVRTAAPGLPDDILIDLTDAGVTVGWHALRDRWCLLGATQGGLILGRVLAALEVDRTGLAALDELAMTAPDRPDALVITSGSEVHINPAATSAEIWRAATTIVTAQAAALSDRLSASAGPRARLVIAGGWANSTALVAAKRRALGALERTTTEEAGARGAALLAGLAAGVYADYGAFPAVASARGRTLGQED